MKKLPKSWIITTLGESFFEVKNGTTITQNKDNKGFPISRIETIQNNKFDLNRIQYVEIFEQRLLEIYRYQIDDIAFSHINSYEHVGKTAIYEGIPKILVHGMNLLRLRLGHFRICAKYAHLYMLSGFFREEVRQRVSHAVNQVSINQKKLAEIPFILPPLNEQRRIVAKLEVLLGKVDACQKRLEKIPRILKRFRQSVLAAACDGRLTVDWREKNNFNIQDWLSTSLSKVANLRLGKMLDKVKNIGEPTLYLRNINVRWFSFELDNLALIKCTDKDRKDLSICDGDVLICEGGEPGRCAVWSHGKMNLIFQKAIHRVRLVDNVLPYWLMINIKTDADSGHLESYFTGTTIKHLTGQSLAKYSFDVPPLAEQQEIVRRVESLFKLADQLEARYQKAKSYVDKLTQSILAKAFRGELVAQDPNDEPASVLLERIKQEKEAATTEKACKVSVKNKVANKKASKEPTESKEIAVENSISNKEKFIEVMEEKISNGIDKIAVDVEKLGEQMTLPFMENEK